MLQEGFDNGFADPTTMMAGSDGDLVDEQLCRLVGMDVMHAGSKPDDLILIDGNRQMMPFVVQELRHERGIERVVEQVGRDVLEDRAVAGRENSDLSHSFQRLRQLGAPQRHTKSSSAPPDR